MVAISHTFPHTSPTEKSAEPTKPAEEELILYRTTGRSNMQSLRALNHARLHITISNAKQLIFNCFIFSPKQLAHNYLCFPRNSSRGGVRLGSFIIIFVAECIQRPASIPINRIRSTPMVAVHVDKDHILGLQVLRTTYVRSWSANDSK
eukprot:COSAG05_NODE_103_length_19033_cov_99.004278_9_plen_149_part_00